MTIKKLSDKGISLDTQSTTIAVNFVDSIEVKINDTVVNKPGEYEIENISLTALEVPNPDYSGVSDVVVIRSEGIDVGCIFADKGTNKEYLKDLANIDILIVGVEISTENIKKLQTLFEPQYLVFLVKAKEDLKSSLGLPEIIEEKSLKVKEVDFPRGENIIVKPIILK
jgi:hypothetical protein